MTQDHIPPWNRTEEPTVVSSDHDRQRMSHPCYATIAAHRISGDAVLFQSDFRHNGYVQIKIAPATVDRNLSNDWVFESQRPMIEVNLSEAQWAQFVSSLNAQATPCTLRQVQGQYVPGLPAPTNRREQFSRESSEAVQRAHKTLDDMAEHIKTLKLSGAKEKQLLGFVESSRRAIGSTQDFIAEQFAEHMENVTQHAKAEVAGYVAGAVRRIGLEAIVTGTAKDVPPLTLELPQD